MRQGTQVNISSLASSFSSENHFFKKQDDELDIGTYELEVSEFKSEVKHDFRGLLEAAIGLRGPQNDCKGQCAHGYHSHQGYRFQI